MGTKGRINHEAVPPTEPGPNKRQKEADEIESENALGSACSLHPHCDTQNTVDIVQVRKLECTEVGGGTRPTLLYTDGNKNCLAQFPTIPLHTVHFLSQGFSLCFSSLLHPSNVREEQYVFFQLEK